MINAKKVWIDCDPGVDDMTAIILAYRMGLDVVGISTVAGNATHENTYRNARDIVALMGEKTPVYGGAEKPMMRKLLTAPHVHGENGLGNLTIDASKAPHEEKKAWDALYEAACQYDKLTIVAIGPLTNIALALLKYEDLVHKIGEISIMGGGAKYGNATMKAEFNIYDDPEAAKIVFDSGLLVHMFGLDVTLSAYMTEEELGELSKISMREGALISRAFAHMKNFVKTMGLLGVCLHDALPILNIRYPELFTSDMAHVDVETTSTLCLGQTVTDLYSDKQYEPKNARVYLTIDRQQFLQTINDLLSL